MARYALHQPILVIGFFNRESPFVSHPTFTSVGISHNLGSLDLKDVDFKILSIVPESQHEVPVEFQTDKQAEGYIAYGRCEFPESLWENNIRFTNQYPTASYGQLSTSGDLMWRLKDMDKFPILGILKEERIPWHYETLNTVLAALDEVIRQQPNGFTEFRERILKTFAEEFDAWEIHKLKIAPDEPIEFIQVIPKQGVVDGDGCSSGPTSALPGQTSTIKGLVRCDEHPDRLAVTRMVGEADSFGCEYISMCPACVKAQDEYEETEDRSGQCEWCKQEKPELIPHRDVDEGFFGPVYQVCRDCIRHENKLAQDELDGYDDSEVL
jgi:hypothetical protein